MATSGSTIYQLTRDQLITAAIGQLGVLAAGQSPTTEDIDKGIIFLNSTLAMLRTKGLTLWSRKEYSFDLTANVNTYDIGVGKTLNTPYPIDILQAYIIYPSGGTTKIQMDVVSNYNFNFLPVSTGSTITLTYQPFINYGTLKVWPTPDTDTSRITIIYQRPFEYFTSSTETLDLPEEWYLPIIYYLASLLAPTWGIPMESRKMLKSEAKELMEEVFDSGGEDTSIYIVPGR